MAQTQSITVVPHGTFTFDVDVYAEVWADTQGYSEHRLRAMVAERGNYDDTRNVSQLLSRFEFVGMLAEFETAAREAYAEEPKNDPAQRIIDNIKAGTFCRGCGVPDGDPHLVDVCTVARS